MQKLLLWDRSAGYNNILCCPNYNQLHMIKARGRNESNHPYVHFSVGVNSTYLPYSISTLFMFTVVLVTVPLRLYLLYIICLFSTYLLLCEDSTRSAMLPIVKKRPCYFTNLLVLLMFLYVCAQPFLPQKCCL